jgi:hypothetical protein
MGMTHAWERPTELPTTEFKTAVADIRDVLSQIPVKIGGFDGQGDPIFVDDHLLFNGARPGSCEPFEARRVEFDRRGRGRFWCSCKTELLPYDLSVRIALIILKQHLRQEIRVSSDDTVAGWQKAKDLCQKLCGFGSDFSLES